MYTVRVIPIARGIPAQELSFFAKDHVEPGLIVDALVRGKPVPAWVVSSTDVREEKSALKVQGFALKKLAAPRPRRIFAPGVAAALFETAHYHAAAPGAALFAFSPSVVVSAKRVQSNAEAPAPASVAVDKLALQAESEDRIRAYRSLARGAIARGESIMILVPSVAEAETLAEKLSRGIEEQVLVATSALTKKAALAAWQRAETDPEPLLMIVTASFLTLPRANLQTLVVERESARAYVARERPHLDARVAAEHLAAARGARLILADFPLRVETRARLVAGEIEELERGQAHVRGGGTVRIIDMRTKKDDAAPPGRRKKFSPLSDYARDALAARLGRHERAFVYAARRGLGPLTVCNDCGAVVTDPATGTPMTLEKSTEGNVFISSRSGAVLPAGTPCRTCGGWNLISLGIAAQGVEDALKEAFPNAPLFVLTGDSAPTHRDAVRIRNTFFSKSGAILVGTDRALPYLAEPVEVSLVASVDSMLSIAAWRAHEHALHTLFAIRQMTLEEMIVQTRLPDAPPIAALALGNPSEFVERELKERASFSYPPFSTFIGLTWSGTARAVEKTAEAVRALALPRGELVGPLPARATGKNHYQARAVIRLPNENGNAWPDDGIIAALAALPPDVAVSVDPDDIV